MAKIPFYSMSSQESECSAGMFFEQGGCPSGRDLEHWLQAEADYLEALRAEMVHYCDLQTARPAVLPRPEGNKN